MSIVFPDPNLSSMNLEYFNLSQHLDENPAFGSDSPKKGSDLSTQISLSANITPPQKRRRGRPPKCPTASDGQPSPAAHLSAAVVKQGTPKASAPLMRISPLRGKKRDANRSPTQRSQNNPSPKGGFLMKLDGDEKAEKAGTKKYKRSNSSRSGDSITSVTVSSKDLKNESNGSNSTFKTPSKITINTQENIHLLTHEATNEKHINKSVNPSLLLSSPMPNVKRSSALSEKRDKETRLATKERYNRPVSTVLSSSPATPNSLASSCFSSIIQSSPLYHGYYANQSSPSNPLTSSPIKFQMKPIDIPESKRSIRSSLPSFNNLPKNPFNSPISISKPTSPTRGAFKLSFSIDEQGQAQVIKVRNDHHKPPTIKQSPPQSRPKFTRHESLITINQSVPHLPRTGSLSNVHEAKEQPSISSVLSMIPSSQDYEMFIEPSKMTSDPLVGDLSQTYDFTGLKHTEVRGLMEEEDEEVDDDSVAHDARKALIKMIRRSV